MELLSTDVYQFFSNWPGDTDKSEYILDSLGVLPVETDTEMTVG